MAGLYMKELILRRAGDRILVVAPGNLRPQWVRELSQTTVAEREFVERFKERCGVRTLANAPAKRNQRVRSLTKNLGFPEPRSVQRLHDLRAAEGPIR